MICSLLLLAAACQKNNNNSPYPQISLKGFAPDSVKSGLFSDTSFIQISFFDGDADLTTSSMVKVVDSRSTSDTINLPFPAVDPALLDPTIGEEGTCFIKIEAAILKIRTDSVHNGKGDTLKFTLHVIDAAGHESNRVTTPNLYIRP